MSENRSDDVTDISFASAAYMVNIFPELVKLPPAELFDRLAAHFEAALTAYQDAKKAWLTDPSQN